MTSRLLPVNSSAPATTTRISPSENATEQAADREPQVGVAGDQREVEGSQPDEPAGQDTERERRQQGQASLLDADVLHAFGDLCGGERIKEISAILASSRPADQALLT